MRIVQTSKDEIANDRTNTEVMDTFNQYQGSTETKISTKRVTMSSVGDCSWLKITGDLRVQVLAN